MIDHQNLEDRIPRSTAIHETRKYEIIYLKYESSINLSCGKDTATARLPNKIATLMIVIWFIVLFKVLITFFLSRSNYFPHASTYPIPGNNVSL